MFLAQSALLSLLNYSSYVVSTLLSPLYLSLPLSLTLTFDIRILLFTHFYKCVFDLNCDHVPLFTLK